MLITIVTCTYFTKNLKGEERMEACRASLQSWLRNLKYPELAVHVADDGSDPVLWKRFQGYHQGIRITYSQQRRRGIGASLNAGLAQAWQNGGLALYIQDDLRLDGPLDITFPARLVESQADVMAVRLSLPHPDTTGRVQNFPGLHERESLALVLDPHHYVISLRPFLAHSRMKEIGSWLEGAAAEWAEKEYNERYVKSPKYKVLQWIPNPWFHQNVVNLGGLEPCE